MTDEYCRYCYFWDAEHEREEQGKKMAACLYAPPRAFPTQQGLVTVWPQTRAEARCGKFRRKE